MDPNQLAIILGLLTNGLYTMILDAGQTIEDLAFRKEDLYKRLKNESNFTSIVDEAFHDLPNVIETEGFYEFLKSDQAAEIVKRIYSFRLTIHENTDNLEKYECQFCENPNSLEKVEKDFCEQITPYFNQKEEISTISPQIFYILVECCMQSLDVVVNEKQDLSALDAKIQIYFKINQMFLKQLIDRTDLIRKDLKAQSELNVIVGKDAIKNLITNGDRNKIFIGKYVTMRDDYIYPGEIFNRVDLDHFVGRRWLLGKVDFFLSNHDRGYFILEAEAGFGKTTFLAWLVRERNYIHNFCELTPRMGKIVDGLKNLASQLALAYDLFPEGILPIDVSPRPDYLYSMLEKIAGNRCEEEKIVLVIDALDEAGTFTGQNVLGLPKTLPKGVYIIASQRPVEVTLNIDTAKTHREICRLSDYKVENEDDIRNFLYSVTDANNKPKIATFLHEHNYTREKFVTTLVKKCQGVWIYLHYIIPEIEAGERPISDLDSSPEGVTNYYIEYWAKWRKKSQWYKLYIPSIATLAVAQEAVSVEMLAIWTDSKISVPELKRLIKEQWRPYITISLHEGQEKFRLYHQSLRDFFNGSVKRENLSMAAESFLDELKEATLEAHNHLVERYLTAWGGLNNGLPKLLNPENLIIDDGYGLRNLAFHLEASGRVCELHRLLSLETTKHHNAWYEAKEAYGNVADYMVDVARAWNLSEKESEYQIKQEGKASSIGLEIRYALIYTSINSLSSEIPVDLLVSFLETKKWTEDKVFNYAQNEPDLYRRAFKLISVYQKANNEFIKRDALESAFDTISKIKYDFGRARTLSDLIPYLDGPKKEEAIQKALDATSNIKEETEKAVALSYIIPNLDKRRKEECIEIALDLAEISDEYTAVEVYSYIAPNLDEEEKEELIESAITLASYIQDNTKRAWACLHIVPTLEGRIKEEFIEIALDITYEIKDNLERSKLLSYISRNYLDGLKKEEVIQKAIDSASMIEHGLQRAEILSNIVPSLEGKTKEEVIQKAFDATSKIEDYLEKALTLSSIVPNLCGQTKEQVIQKAIDAAFKIKDDFTRVEALSSIVPILDGQTKEEVVQKAIAAASKIEDDFARVEALSSIVPILDGQTKEEVIQKAFAVISTIENKYSRVGILSNFVPILDGQTKEEVIEEVLDIASKTDEYSRVWVLSTIIPYLDEPQKEEIIQKAIDAVSNIEEDYHRSSKLRSIVENLDWIEKEEVIQKALDVAYNIEDCPEKAAAFSALSFNLDGPKKEELIQKALDVAFKVEDDYERVGVLSYIIPNLDELKREEVIQKALDLASKIDNDDKRIWALSNFIPYLDEPQKNEVIEKALDVASRIQYDDDERALALLSIISKFDGQIKDSVIEKAIYEVAKIDNRYVRTEALHDILSHFKNMPVNNLYLLWRKTIKILRELSRSNLLVDIATLIPIISVLGNDKMYVEISQAIIDTSRWWS